MAVNNFKVLLSFLVLRSADPLRKTRLITEKLLLTNRINHLEMPIPRQLCYNYGKTDL